MALGSGLNIRVSKADFEQRIATIELKMTALRDVINRYNDAKRNLDQFVESNDHIYEAMIERIDKNIMAAGKAYAELQETKVTLQATVDKMENLGKELKETIEAATDAAKNTIEAAIKIDAIL